MTLSRLRITPYALIASAAMAIALTLVVLSLRWPVEHDLPIMMYDGYLIHDLGMVPYRDFFEVNPPGTMLLNVALHRLTGGETLPARTVDLLLLASICTCTYLIFRRISPSGGIVAASCFVIVYLGAGPTNSLQRDYLCVPLLAGSAALVFAGRRSRGANAWSAPLFGFLAGCAVTIKPTLALCWIPLAIYWEWERREETHHGERPSPAPIIRPAILLGTGFLIPIIGTALWLYAIGALPRYIEIMSQYYPLYANIDGNGFVSPPGFSTFIFRYGWKPIGLVGAFPFVAAAAVGAMSALNVADRRVVAKMAAIAAMAGCALLHVAIGGKFWFYHCIPLYFSMSLLVGFAFCAAPSARYLVIILVAIACALPYNTLGSESAAAKAGLPRIVRDGRVDAIAEYLASETTDSTTILPLDETAGAIHAMYRVRRPLYGGFIYDIHFYHDVGHPFVKALRAQLLSRFTETAPEVIISCLAWRPRGYGCAESFPELDQIIKDKYAVVLQGNGFTIFRRVKPAGL